MWNTERAFGPVCVWAGLRLGITRMTRKVTQV